MAVNKTNKVVVAPYSIPFRNSRSINKKSALRKLIRGF